MKKKIELYKYIVTQTTYVTMEIMAENEGDACAKMRDEMSMQTKDYIQALESACDDYNAENLQ